MKSPFSPVDGLRTEVGATHQELDRLLAHLKVTPAKGLESRVLARLEAQSESGILRGSVPWSRGWAPAAIAASLFCVFAGGVLVARQTSAANAFQHEAHAATVSAQQAMPRTAMALIGGRGVTTAAVPSTRSMDTAAARRRPTTQILVGRRRGRATTSTVIK